MKIQKSIQKKETRTRNWWFVLYPESAPEDWKQRIDDLHIQYAISPLHDKDKNPDGELKKPHWHIILMFESVKSYQQIKEITDGLNAPIPQAVNGLVGTVRYLIHKDNPDKYQYKKTEIITGGGFDVVELINRSPSDKRAILKEIYEFIKSNDVTEFCELTDYAFENNSDWFEILMDGHTMVFDAVIKSRRHSSKLQQERDVRKQAEASKRLKVLREKQGIKVDEVTGEILKD